MGFGLLQAHAQGAFHPGADRRALPPGLPADLGDQSSRKFDRENRFLVGNRQRRSGSLSLLEVAIGLTPGQSVKSDNLAQDPRSGGSLLE